MADTPKPSNEWIVALLEQVLTDLAEIKTRQLDLESQLARMTAHIAQ